MYFLVNKNFAALSEFRENDKTGHDQLHFRKHDAMTFPTFEEARYRLDFIKSRNSGAAYSLKISSYAVRLTKI